MGCDLETYRATVGCFAGVRRRTTRKGTEDSSGHCEFYALILCVLLVIGGVEVNPGPDILVEAVVHREKCGKCRKNLLSGLLCGFCGSWFHFSCQNVKRDQHVEDSWKCKKCVANERIIVTQTNNFEEEIADLKCKLKKADEKIKLLKEENTKLRMESGKSCNCTTNVPKLSEPTVPSTLVIGDSIVRHVAHGNPDVAVKCFPGIRTKQLAGKMEECEAEAVKNIIVHVGTNDSKGGNTEQVMGDMYDLIATAKRRYPQAGIVICGVIRRRDVHWRKIGRINDSFEWVAKKLGVSYVDPNSWLRDGNIGRDGVHLNRSGVASLGDLFGRVASSGPARRGRRRITDGRRNLIRNTDLVGSEHPSRRRRHRDYVTNAEVVRRRYRRSYRAGIDGQVYRTDDSKPWVLPVVKRLEAKIVADENLNHEYLMFRGMDSLSDAATRFLLGEDSPAIMENRAFGIHSLSGTGSLRIAAEFLSRVLQLNTVYISEPTWDNYVRLFKNSGVNDIREYRYWDDATRSLDFDGLIADISKAPKKSIIVLQMCAHNPTGWDPTEEQWMKIADVMQERCLFPFFDGAYQGFASGDVEKDVWPVRHFVDRGFELFCAQSFSKNMGLYGERVGNLAIVVKNASVIPNIKSQMDQIIRPLYQSPPSHGAKVANAILHDRQLMEEWKDCIKVMTDRIIKVRIGLKQRLEKIGTPGNWDHIVQQRGMFSFTGLSEPEVLYLREKWHIYLKKDGRANMCGITTKNIDYVAEAIHDTVTKFQK